ncbi:ParA family protein [Flavobacterium psychrophilum]|uniref:ParA family protein n=1 Tax=Flavobacterium psychrophilum TaxID=96345 RepID=UPI001425AB25|nr:ParA family protein [Flavobacterium psychrophilum]
MQKIITVITEKGGVGKTTSTIHIGATLSKKGYKTLLIDFDAQRNLSMGYNIPKDFPYTVHNFLNLKFSNFGVFEKDKNLSILAGSREIEKFDFNSQDLQIAFDKLKQLKFDYILIDCPPRPLDGKLSLGEIALRYSDYIISPIDSEKYSIEGINELLPSIRRIKNEFNSKLTFLGFFFNRVRENTVKYKKYRKLALLQAKDIVFMNIVRQDVAVENSKDLGKTVFEVAPGSNASKDYLALVDELLIKIKK